MIHTKPFFKRRFHPVADRLADAGVTANQVTITAGLLSSTVGTAIIVAPGDHWPLLIPFALGLVAAPGVWPDTLLVTLLLVSALTIANRVQGP
jgi:hypothetical protein